MLRMAEFRECMISLGAIPGSGSSRELEKIFRDEYSRWTRLAAEIKLQAEYPCCLDHKFTHEVVI